MGIKSRAWRTALLAGIAVTGALVVAVPAAASTSHSKVYHADGNVAGEAWFNSGLHAKHQGHPEHGFNSFTIKDLFCGDRWGIGVQWILGDQTFTHQLNFDCAPVEANHETGQAATILAGMNWRPFMHNIDGIHDNVYGEWRSDWMGSLSTESTVLIQQSTVYNDRLTDDSSPHTFTASMKYTRRAFLGGEIITGPMWRDLQELTPLPSSLTPGQLDSMYKQLYCHAMFARLTGDGGDTWDIESARPNIPWRDVILKARTHRCNW
jgi:hypothetical protein